MPRMSISIIIPHLNQEAYLSKCLSSLKRQDNTDDIDIEIIVVDNGSSEMPTRTVKAFNGVRLIKQPIPGPGPARNKGVSVSKGDVLAFIDADCTAHKNWLATIRDKLGSGGSLQIIGGDVRIARVADRRATVLEAYESVYAYRQKEYIEQKGFSGTGNLAVSRAAFDCIGPFAGIDVAEDRDWGQRAGQLGYRIAYVPQMIVYHPARDSFEGLYLKWDRHIAHDYGDYCVKSWGRCKWFVYGLAVLVSPSVELIRILRSSRVTGVRERAMALYGVARTRLYRAWRMFDVLLKGDADTLSRSWNRLDP